MKRIRPLSLARESCVLLAICLLDLVLTVWLIATQRALEGNPIMAFYLRRGWVTLIFMKLLLVILPLFIAEWARRHRPVFVRRVLRIAIVAYVAMYGIAFFGKDIVASGHVNVDTILLPAPAGTAIVDVRPEGRER